MRVPCMYMCFNGKWPHGILTFESIDHNGAWSVLPMGAISMVKEHNTNGGRLMSIIVIIRAKFNRSNFYTLIPGLSPFNLFELNLIFMCETFLRRSS